jgi:DNA-binding transcriptional MerR regulator
MQLHLSSVYVLQNGLSLEEIAQLFESEQSDSNSSSVFSTGASAIRTMPTAREKQLAEEWLKSEIPELSGATVWKGVKLLGSGYRL